MALLLGSCWEEEWLLMKTNWSDSCWLLSLVPCRRQPEDVVASCLVSKADSPIRSHNLQVEDETHQEQACQAGQKRRRWSCWVRLNTGRC